MMTIVECERSDAAEAKAEELRIALKEALQYLECTDGRRGCIGGCVVSTATYNVWKALAEE